MDVPNDPALSGGNDPLSVLNAANALDAQGTSAPAQTPGDPAISGANDPMAVLNAANALDTSGAHIGPPQAGQLSAGSRFAQGAVDVPVGFGQITEHVAQTPLNWLRAGIRGALNAGGFQNAASLFGNVTSQDFDNIVAQREQSYQQARAAAHQNGIDWWRIAGNAAASAPLVFAGGPAETVAGRIGQSALIGGAQGASQPSVTPGDFWWDKARGAGTGAVLGAGTAGMVEGVLPALRWGANAILSRFGTAAGSAEAAQNADTVVNESLKARGVDPNTVDLNVLKGMRADVADALSHKVSPSPVSIASRAEAESLPDPIQLTRGQASGDAMQFAKERNLRGIVGAGEPITQRLTDQNVQLVNNLDLMGAKGAPDIVAAGQEIGDRIRAVENAFTNDDGTGSIDRAYALVKNAEGQPLKLDDAAFSKSVKDELGEDFRFLPDPVQEIVNAAEQGKLGLTVKMAQSLDKSFTGLQSGAPLNNTTDRALGIVKAKLLDTPIDDSLPHDPIVLKQTMDAYQAAKSLAKQRFDLMDSVPAYKAVVTGAKSGEADQLFNRYVIGGSAREIGALGRLTDMADTNLKAPGGGLGGVGGVGVGGGAGGVGGVPTQAGAGSQLIGRALMGEIRRRVVQGVGDRVTFNGNELNKYVANPVWNAKLTAALPKPLVTSLERLNRVAANIQRAPSAAAVNMSNTGSAVVNAATSAIKAGIGQKIAKGASFFPGLATAGKAWSDAISSTSLARGVRESLNPGVTAKPLPSLTPDSQAWRALLGRAGTVGVNAKRQGR